MIVPARVTGSAAQAAAIAVGLLVAALAGAMVATGTGAALLALLGGFALLPLAYFALRRFADQSGWLLVAGWVLMLIAHVTLTTTSLPVGYLQEAALFGLALVVMRQLAVETRADRTMRLLVFLWITYLALSLVSTFLGRSQVVPALWQLQYNLKWPLMFGLGLLMVWGSRADQQLRRIVIWSLPVLATIVTLEAAAPTLHRDIFGPSPDLHVNPLLGFGARHRGPFSHAGYLGLSCGLLAAAAIAQVMTGRSKLWLLPALAYVTLVLLSGQRQEVLALAIVVLLFAALRWARYWYLIALFSLVVIALAAAVLLYLDHVPMRTTLEQSGLLPSPLPYSERATLTLHGVAIARDYWPLGAGLGTYGGVGAMKFDQSLFLEQGFMQYWWYRQGLFLVDTFWPGVIAESGFIGAGVLFALLMILWSAVLRRTWRLQGSSHYGVALTALAGLTLMLANSPSSGALTDPRSTWIFWLLIGAVWRVSRTVDASDSRTPRRLQANGGARDS